MSEVVDSDYANSSAKSAAINKGVFGELAEAKLREELQTANFLTIAFDGSNIQGRKLLPIFAIFFDRQTELQHRLLNIVELTTGETGEFVAWAIKETIAEYQIPEEKIVAICADNCPTNYGSVKRGGDNNVFAHLRKTFGDKLIGIGCLAHVLNNALKNAADMIKFKGDTFSKILSLLHCYFEREGNRKGRFSRLMISLGCASAYLKKPTRSYCKTRWLTTGPALDAIVSNYDALYFYFDKEEEGKHLDKFKPFFEDEDTYPWLVILRAIASEFEEAITEIESQGMTLLDGIHIFENLKSQVFVCVLFCFYLKIYFR